MFGNKGILKNNENLNIGEKKNTNLKKLGLAINISENFPQYLRHPQELFFEILVLSCFLSMGWKAFVNCKGLSILPYISVRVGPRAYKNNQDTLIKEYHTFVYSNC